MAPGRPEWCAYVQQVRAKIRSAGIKHIVSPRATSIGAALLDAGMTREQAIAMTVRKGLDDATWQKVAA